MKRLALKLITIASIALITSYTTINACDPVEEVKAKWMKWANENVEREKAKLLDYYKISSELLNDKEIQEKLREIRPPSSNDFLHLEEDPQDPILQLAKSILSCDECKNIKVKYTHRQNASIDITIDKSTATCCISLNPVLFDENKDEIIDSLLHEKSHAIHHDADNRDQITTSIEHYSPAGKKLIALEKVYDSELRECSNELIKNIKNDDALFKVCDIERKRENNIAEYLEFSRDISKNISQYRKAQETRADIYAATTSTQRGNGLITSYQKHLKKELQGLLYMTYNHHPHHKDRIALLQQIKSELQSAEREKQSMINAMRAMSDDQLV